MKGWVRKFGRLGGAQSAKRRYLVLEDKRQLLFIRKGPGLKHVGFIDLRSPIAVKERSARGFDVVCGTRARTRALARCCRTERTGQVRLVVYGICAHGRPC